MKNVQITFDEDMIKDVDRIASLSRTTRSAVIRDAITQWLRQRESKEFEKKWIQCLEENPDDPEDAEKWLEVQEWSEE